MYAPQLFQMSADLTTLAGLLEGRSARLVEARGSIADGFSVVADNWTGGYANPVLAAKDTWLDGIAGIETAIADGVTVIREWATRTFEVAERVQSLTRTIEWFESFAEGDAPAPVNRSELVMARTSLSTLTAGWPAECTGFGTRLAEPIAALERAAALRALPDGSYSAAEYYVAVSYLLQATGLDLDLVDPEGDFEATAKIALEQMAANPAMFTALEALSAGTIEGADNSWEMLDFELARDHPELVTLLLQQYSAAYGMDWSNAEIESMVAQLVVFGAVLMTAPEDVHEEFDDAFVDPNVEASLRAMVEVAKADDGFDVWTNQHHYPDYEDWWYVEDDPAKHARLIRDYAAFIEDQNTPWNEKLLGPFRDWVVDDRPFYGEDANAVAAAVQAIGILPFGKLGKLGRIFRIFGFNDEARDAVHVATEATETAQTVIRVVAPDDAAQVIDDAAEIADDAVENLDQVDELLTDDPVLNATDEVEGGNPTAVEQPADTPRFDPASDPLEVLTPEQVVLAEQNYVNSGRFVIGPFEPRGGGPSYIEVADDSGSSYFDVGDEWNSMTPAQQAASNQHALDLAIVNHDVVTLSAPRDVVSRFHPSTAAEIDYLLANGYEWLDSSTLVPKGSS